MPPITRKGVYITMRKRTSTQKLLKAITNNLLQVTKAECSYKSSKQIGELSKETFMDNLAFINESGIFSGFIDWHYDKILSEKDVYIADSGAMNPYTDTIVTVYLRMNDNATDEEIQKALLLEESED